ncbi:competence protein ComGA [Barrientosiimonas marina]|uniref:Competence type IV pilus ATPase ComGA n=1 Tax=Lentibacillus kimchii TaxID=1542911 RepID=A0ABW2UZJ5_9BACI
MDIAAAKLSKNLLQSAVNANASDIHFYPLTNHVSIFFRVHGKRNLHKTISASQYQLLLTYYKFTSGMDIGEVRKPQNGTTTYEQISCHYALRLSTLPIKHTESLAIRILPQENNLTLDNLFLFPDQLTQLKKWITNKSGIILLTGPTGSGKTTTLYALLQKILTEASLQTITLEDPIEKDIDNILQVQVNEKAGMTYQTGLKAALRHDPDILMIGEIRDRFTAEFAFEASLTGHLVLSTLHAKNARGTISRLLDMGMKKNDLRQSLIAVAALELLPVDRNQQTTRRAAIMELLEGPALENTINGGEPLSNNQFHTFQHLRKKALAYGFITNETFLEAGQ